MNIVIKELDKDSINDVQEFLFKQIKLEFGYGYVPEWHKDIINMEKYYVNPTKNNFFIALNEKTNEIIATIGVRGYDKNFDEFKGKYFIDKTSSIWRLFVDKKYRRCGIASKMFSVAEIFSSNCGYSNIYLHTHKTLDGAMKFWMKMGFVVTIDTHNELETVHMDKQIRGLEFSTNFSDFNYAVEL